MMAVNFLSFKYYLEKKLESNSEFSFKDKNLLKSSFLIYSRTVLFLHNAI